MVTKWEITFPEAANLLKKLGYYFRENYQEEKEEEEKAEYFLLQALEIRKHLWGSEHIEVAQSLDDLGFLYRNQGKYDEAEQLHQQAFTIKKKLLSPEDNRRLVSSYNNFALIYFSQGKYSEAEHLYQRALAILEQKPESEVSYILPMCLHNLGNVYEYLGNYSQAEQLHQRALAFTEKVLGSEDFEMAWNLKRLAVFYQNRRKYIEAEHLYKRSLERCSEGLSLKLLCFSKDGFPFLREIAAVSKPSTSIGRGNSIKGFGNRLLECFLGPGPFAS